MKNKVSKNIEKFGIGFLITAISTYIASIVEQNSNTPFQVTIPLFVGIGLLLLNLAKKNARR